MLISDARRIIFVHVPKTGGVSIEGALLQHCTDARKLLPSGKSIGRHAPLGRILRNEPQALGYWSFGFVRNPWARLLSWYSMIDQWNHRHGPASGKPQGTGRTGMKEGNEMWHAAAAYSDFNEFVVRGIDELPRVGVSQLTYLRAPKFGKEVDFIGRTEQLATDLAVVQRRLGVTPEAPPHRNKSRHGSYRDYYGDEARDKVADAFAEDIERFGYTY